MMDYTTDQEVRLPELVHCLDGFLKSKGKKSIFEIIEELEEEYDRKENERKRGEKIERSNETIGNNEKQQENQRKIKYDTKKQSCKEVEKDLHPEKRRKKTTIKVGVKRDNRVRNNQNVVDNQKAKDDHFLPNIYDSSRPIRPTELLCRILDRKEKMKPDIYIPRMSPIKENDSRSYSYRTSASTYRKDRHNCSAKREPHFMYDHGEGRKRNLPGEPELIRLLTDPEMSLGGSDATKTADGEKSGSNMWLSLYGGPVSPPIIDKNQQTRNRRRKIVCKYCRRSPGDHQKWCVFYTDIKEFVDPKQTIVRSYTSDEIDLKLEDNVSELELERSKTSLEDIKLPPLPDYSTLHRDVYMRALSDAQVRLIKKKARDFMTQTTRPFVFSYFENKNKRKPVQNFDSKETDAMEHIFGKNQTDFTEYYKIISDKDK
ncbi:hypothetical protein ACF0H5_005839 [Mactra antiquata]